MASVGQVWSSHSNAVRNFTFGLEGVSLTKDFCSIHQGCGNSTNGGKAIDPSNCIMACSGDSTENCGGPDALVLYYLDGN
jgi:hypothetical protein